MTPAAAPLLFVPAAGIIPISDREADDLLTEWGHNLGPCDRPFRVERWALCVDSEPVSLAITASAVSSTVTDETGRVWKRKEIVDLARLCTKPGERWATRVMLRLWREVAAPRWDCWPVKAAIAYSQNDRHEGRIYRYDGWTRWQSKAGRSGGGGQWSSPRPAGSEASGDKTLWGWRYA